MPWLAMINAVLALALIGVLIGAPFAAAGAGEASYLVGIGSEFRWAFVIPVVILLLTVLIIVGVIAGWRSGAWGLGRKLYRGALALASVALTVVLVLWNTVVTPLLG
jgi:hypothetical protein